MCGATPLHNAFTYRSYSWYVDVDGFRQLPLAAPAARGFPRVGPPRGPGGTHPRQRGAVPADPGDRARRRQRSPCWPAPGCSATSSTRSASSGATDAAGDLRCVVAEVHNTYGERHCYLLRHGRRRPGQCSDKAFYVSPFNDVDGQYRMKLPEPGERLGGIHRAGARRAQALCGHR